LAPARSVVRGCRGPHGRPRNRTDPRGPHRKNVKIAKSWQTAANYPPCYMGTLGQAWWLSRGAGSTADPRRPHGPPRTPAGRPPRDPWSPEPASPVF
jgi:hypothetical protein